MGLPRTARRKVVSTSSDGEDEDVSNAASPNAADITTSVARSVQGKLKPVKKNRLDRGPNTKTTLLRNNKPASPQSNGNGSNKIKTNLDSASGTSLKPIYSFFAAQQQKSSPNVPELPKAPSKFSETDVIQDNSDDYGEDDDQPYTGSSTALAARKRKLQAGEDILDYNHTLQVRSQKFTRNNSGNRLASPAVEIKDQRSWIDRFAPKDISELAVHKRKVDDVRQWLESTIRGVRPRVLVLKGGAGTGKTTTVNLLARDLGLEVLEWRNPIAADWTPESSNSTSAQFAEFVARAGQSEALKFDTDIQVDGRADIHNETTVKKNQLLLVEEFPSTYSSNSNTLLSFRTSIAQYLAASTPSGRRCSPLVLVISETLSTANIAASDSFTTHRLLGPELSNHPFLNMIEFNPVAPTILTKALQTIVVKEARISGRRKTPGPQVLKHLAGAGDIRSAVSSLEFLCLRGDEGDIWSSKVMFTKPKGSKVDPPLTKAEEEILKLVSNRESTLGIFHSVGKVIYNKRTEPDPNQPTPQLPPWLLQHNRNRVPENNIDQLYDEVGTDTTTFIAALHENYATSCYAKATEETLDSMLGCISNLSDADLLCLDRFSTSSRAWGGTTIDGFRQEEIAYQVAVRGLWFNLPYPVNRAAQHSGRRGDGHRIYYPVSTRLWRKVEETRSMLDLLSASLASGNPTSGLVRDVSSTKLVGVESWGRNTSVGSNVQDAPSNNTPEPATGVMSSARTEMLTERLPYLASIMEATGRPSVTLNRIKEVTRIVSEQNEHVDADLEADDDDAEEFDRTQKTTKRGGAAVDTSTSASKHAFGQQEKPDSTPVDDIVRSLVLEDDDIEDD